MQSIRDLIDSAIIDPDVKGGLRWPLEKASSGKYNVVGVWHVIAKAYKNQSLRFKVRHADRFDFRTSVGEASWEINVRLEKVVAKLKVSATISLQHLHLSTSYYIHLSIGVTSFSLNFQEEKVEVNSISEMLEENMKFIWDNFLSCERFLT